mmetsp:Transcript_4246/g.16009  ORF Transcript_4246/g.16009 Transcript_4246/m.16009 type:complete len:322 (-) Transcript_4246:180-1145(-)|eukprot:CAMPEP_0117445624 /NCGR_PEP_ID=MMETSP0759-20121206/5898_1 /TAXON_ID=63605 /ORGANISM="Percolomonas cosmopolitus, Strain WS" /LENGTH=321 /DNA_ID=CAMNT_0005237819 /DNA_START=320 /DNA_END=1285 /DNA_ORIENTATION=+
METTARSLKALLRATIKQNLLALPRANLYRESFQITQQLVHSGPLYQNATHLCFYSPMQHEIQLLGLLHKALSDQKACFVPVVESRRKMDMFRVYSWKDYTIDFEKQGKYQIWEPKQLHFRDRLVDTMDSESRLLVVMPGLAFDRQGGRLGYGGGYYDRYLKSLMERFGREQITLVAPALETQLVDEVPTTEDDIRIDAIITKKGIEFLQHPSNSHVTKSELVPSLMETIAEVSTRSPSELSPMTNSLALPNGNASTTSVLSNDEGHNKKSAWWKNKSTVSYSGLHMKDLKELITHNFQRFQGGDIFSENFQQMMNPDEAL